MIATQIPRDAVRAATPKRMRKLHWYEATDGQRLTWIGLLVHTAALVVVLYDGAPARAERRRRRCLERLVWELERREVHVLALESRGSARDSSDASMLESLRARGVGHTLRYEHVRGADEPLLGLADTACGAHLHGMIPAATPHTVIAVS